MTLHFFSRIRFFRRRATLDRELAEELEFHRAMKQQENEGNGLTAIEAQQAAQRQMGNLTQARESSRDVWSFPVLEQLAQDVSVALRSLRRDRGFAAVAILSLALGIGANTAIFTALNAVLLRPLPYPQPKQLFGVTEPMPPLPSSIILAPEFEAWRSENKSFDQLAAWNMAELDFAGSGSPEHLTSANVTANFLRTVRVALRFGRDFSKEEDRPDGPHSVILTDSFWRKHSSASQSVLGKEVKLNNDVYTVIGILPASFRFPGDIRPDILVPSQLPSKPNWGTPSLRGTQVIGRLHRDVMLARAKIDLQMISKRQERNMPPYLHHYRRKLQPLQITPLQTYLAGDTRWTLLLLLIAVVILLGIACANVANLQVSRAAARQSELALRAALGAGRGRIVRFLLTESLLIALAGGGCGALLAWGLVRLLSATAFLHLSARLSVDGTVLLFTLLISLLTGLVCGLFPALLASKPVLYTAIKGRSAQLLGLGVRFRGLLVVSEVALTLVLLIGALLLFRSLQQVLAVNPGFQPENVLTFETNFPDARNRTPVERATRLQLELEHIAALPGVHSVGASSSLFLIPYLMTAGIAIEGQPAAPPGQRPPASTLVISPGYFRTMRIPLLAGRSFSRNDADKSLPVAMINASFARRFFPGVNPIGKRLQYGAPSDLWVTIIGVVADVHHNGLEKGIDPELILPYTQNFPHNLGIAVRSTLAPSALVSAIRKQIAQVDPEQPMFDIATMEHRLSESIGSRRTQTALISSFALIALCLAAIGVYGVLSYAVTQSTREIGIRMALGAPKGRVLRSIVRRGAMLAIGGIVIGLTVLIATVRYLTSFLYQVKPLDWISFTGGSVVILALAIFASYLPARRAAAVDPMTALRYE
jgi:putative ABC transport system permease protein